MNSKYLDELIILVEKKEIPYTRKYLEKQSEETLERIYERHREKELDELNETIVDTVIGKFDEFMKSFKFISKQSKLGKKLQDKKLFRNDMKSFISLFTPLFPYAGLLEGTVCVVNEIINNDDSNKPESVPEEGGEQASTEEEPDSHPPAPEPEDTKP